VTAYQITHRTVYRYSDVVTSSYGRGFLTPRDSARQRCLSHELIIEPDDRRRSAMIARLTDRGDRITACRCVKDAMVVLAGIERPAHTPHAIVSDVHLGDGDGLSFYLAASRRFPDIRWIVTTPPQLLPAVA